MKRTLLTFLIVSVGISAFAQTNMYWYNPFSFTPGLTGYSPELIAQDTSGQIWFFTSDGYSIDSFLVIRNQSGTVEYTLPQVGVTNSAAIFFDGANRLWINANDIWYLNINGTLTQFWVPNLVNSPYSPVNIIPDNVGNDYFLTESYDSTGVTGFFVTKYDGSTFQTTNMFGLGIPFNDSTVMFDFAFCDNTGALYVSITGYGFMKLYQGNWSHLPANFDIYAPFVAIDKFNNSYFSDVYDGNNYVIKWDGNAVDTIPLPNPMPYYFITSFTIGPDGNLWFLLSGNGFYELTANNTWTYIPAPGWAQVSYQFNANFFPAIFDRAGLLWTTGGSSQPPYNIGVYSFIPFNSIQGNVFYDSNGNGIADPGEPAFTGMNIVQPTNGYYSSPDSNGNYVVIYLDSTINHVVSASAPQYYHLTTPSSYTVLPGDSQCCYNFGVVPDGAIQDLQIGAGTVLFGSILYGNTSIGYYNNGTTTASGTVTYVCDSMIHYTGAIPNPTTISGNTITWTYQNLHPFEGGTIFISWGVDSNIAVSDIITGRSSIQPLATDTTPADNVYVDTAWVLSSFDPNLKTVSPETLTKPGQQLTYTIYFQNTGTAPAVNVVVRDTLDANLNPATFKLLGSSSPVKVSLQGPGVLGFTFSNINLPDSSNNTIQSIGFVKFAISLADPLNSSAPAISNTAWVYFDFNSPVETNTTQASISRTVGIPSITKGNSGLSIKMVPNPAGEEASVVTNVNIPGAILNIYDAIGNLVAGKTIASENTELDLRKLAAGIYLIQVISKDGGIASDKLIKQ